MPDHTGLDQRLLTMRILHGSLCLGAVTAGALLGWMRLTNPPPQPATPVVSYVGFVAAAVCLLLSFVAPNVVVAGWIRQMASGKWPIPNDPDPGSESSWWGIYTTRLIIGMALLEGAVFLQVIAYYIDGLPASLGVAGGLFVVMLTRFPTRSGVENWVAAQREQVEMMKQDRS